MVKSMKPAAIVATALCFSSLLSFAFPLQEAKFVEGMVYCDSCRVHYRTNISEFIQGATVALRCKEREDGDVVFSREVVTDKSGIYRIPTEGCRARFCEVRLTKSPNPECNEIVKGLSSARIDISPMDDDEPVRYANDIGAMSKKASPNCPQVLEAMFLHG